MNHIYRLIWNARSQSYAAVAETAKGRGKHSGSTLAARLAIGWLLGLMLPTAHGATPISPTTLPGNGQVSSGQARINAPVQGPTGATLTIDQSSQRATINWGSFDLGSSATVNFNQTGASAATLNRVQSGQASQILGKLNAPGQVFLLNASGILFGTTSQVNVGGLVATSYHLSDADFMAGRMAFERAGTATPGSVTNQGSISTSIAGYAALLAPEVRNDGIILARGGTVALASGDAIALQFVGSQLIDLQVTPSTLAALVENHQAILAPDGLIILAAKAAPGLLAGAIQNSGVLDASSAVNKGGRIVLEANAIELQGASQLLANGPSGGGTVLVGGDWQGSNGGSNAMLQATRISMDRAASIQANATQNGDGGKVVLWSDVHNASGSTAAHGSIQASAGAEGGNGGQVETSGHSVDLAGVQVHAGVPKTQSVPGKAGLWLIDPYDYTIDFAEAGSIATSLTGGTSVTVDTSADVVGFGSNGNVASAGNITMLTFRDIITGAMTTDATLTLKAHNDIVMNGFVAIDATQNGNTKKLNVVFTSDQDADGAGSIVLNNSSAIKSNGGNITLGGGIGGDARGIGLDRATLDAGGGDISLHGQGLAGSSNLQIGVYLSGATLVTSGAGNITIVGTGGDASGASQNDAGVAVLDASTITGSTTGATAITGTGGGGIGFLNHGVWVGSAGSIISSTGGPITVTGFGGAGTGTNNSGVAVVSDGRILAGGANGSLTVTGTGGGSGASGGNHGVDVEQGGVIGAAGDGNVSVTGFGSAAPGGANSGVVLNSTLATSSISSNGGTLTVTGTGGANGTGGNNHGVHVLSNALIQSGNGNMLVTGVAGGTGAGAANNGVLLEAGGVISSTGSGSVTIVGTGGSLGGAGTGSDSNNGVFISGAGSRIRSSGGAISVTGNAGDLTGDDGGINNGVRVSGGAVISGGTNASVLVSGTGGGNASITGGGNDGVLVDGAGSSISADGSGTLTVTGIGGMGAAGQNQGVAQVSAGSIIGGSTGTTTVTGTGGGSGNSGSNVGVLVDSAGTIGSGGGAVTVSGTGGGGATGAGNHGVQVAGASSSIGSGGGNVSVTGQGGNAGGTGISQYGVLVNAAGGITAGGTGTVTVVGTGGSSSGVSNVGVNVSGAGSAITSAAGSVSVTGSGGGSGNSSDNIGVLVDAAGKLSSGGGTVTVSGTGGANAGAGNTGVQLTGAGSTITSAGGAVTITGIGGSGAGIDNYGTFATTGSSISSGANAPISVTTDSYFADNSFAMNAGSGTVTVQTRSAGNLIDLGGADGLSGSPRTLGLSSAELNEISAGNLIIGRNDGTASGAVTVRAAVSPTNAPNVTVLTGGNININADLGATGQLTLTPGASALASGNGNITTPALLLNGSSANYALNTAVGNAIGTVAASGAGNLNLLNSVALTIGSVGATSGVDATGSVAIATASGNLFLTQAVSTTDTSTNAVFLNAGQTTAAGTASGGNLIASGAAAVSTGTGGRATLMSGSVAGTTAAAALAGGSGSGRYRYNSDETTTNYTAALGAGTYLIYREAPALAIAVNNDIRTYSATAYSGGNGYTATSALQNGDTANSVGPATFGGTAQGAIIAGTYTLTAGAGSPLGYVLTTTAGTLTIGKADLVLTGSKTYDANTTMAGANLTATGVAGESFSVDGAGAAGNLSTANVQTNQLLASITGLSLGAGAGGGVASNYNSLSTVASRVNVDKADLVLTGSKTYDASTAMPGSNLTATGVAGESFSVTGAGAADNLATANVQTNQALQSVNGLALGTSSNGALSSNYRVLSAIASRVSVLEAVSPPTPTPTPSTASKTHPPTPTTPLPVQLGRPSAGQTEAGVEVRDAGSAACSCAGAAIDSSRNFGGSKPTDATDGGTYLSCNRQMPDNSATNDNGFTSVLRFEPVKVQVGARFDWTLPSNTFVHSKPAQSVQLQARQFDGQSLPAWLRFDPGTRTFSGRPPEDVQDALQVMVVAQDASGSESCARATLVFGTLGP
jgi:filamentous hemagglutinin family protein